jgi:hypothetical protein
MKCSSLAKHNIAQYDTFDGVAITQAFSPQHRTRLLGFEPRWDLWWIKWH